MTGSSGRSSIPETSAIDPRGRGVLDAPLSRGMTASMELRPGLLAIGQMHRAVAAGRMRRDVVGGGGGGRRQGRHRFLDATVLRRLVLGGDVVQDRRQPALGFRHAPALALRIVLDLVALDLADAEIETFGVAEICLLYTSP